MAFPVYVGGGVYVLSDSSKVKGKQTAKAAEGKLGTSNETPEVPKDYKGPICPRCGDFRVKVLAAAREAAESREPTHRAAVGVKMLPAQYICGRVGCGMRWIEG